MEPTWTVFQKINRHMVLQVKDLTIQVAEHKFDPITHMKKQMW